MERKRRVITCANLKCTKVVTPSSASPWYCSDNCQSMWLSRQRGIDNFPMPEYVPVQVLPRYKETRLSWLDGGQ